MASALSAVKFNDYDFAQNFFHPVVQKQFLPDYPDFGQMMTRYFHDKIVFQSSTKKPFDHVTYFVHFFLGLLNAGQYNNIVEEKETKTFYWNFDPIDGKLRAFRRYKMSDGRVKLVLKCFDFETQKKHTWSLQDLADVASTLKLDVNKMGNYDVQSHWYNIQIENTVGRDENDIKIPYVFVMSNAEMLDTEFMKSFKKNVAAWRLFKKMPMYHDVDRMHKYLFDVSQSASKDNVVNGLEVFLAHISKDYLSITTDKSFFDVMSTYSEAHCGFLHGTLTNFQSKYSLQPEIHHFIDDTIEIRLERSSESLWTDKVTEIPLFIEIEQNLHQNLHNTERRAPQLIRQRLKSRQSMSVESLSDSALLFCVNLNAAYQKTSSAKIPIANPLTKDFVTTIQMIVGKMEENFENEDILRSMKQKFDKTIGEILAIDMPAKNKYEKMKYLSRYLTGILSTHATSSRGEAFTFNVKNPQIYDQHRNSFLIKGSSGNVDIVLNIFENEYFDQGTLNAINSRDRNSEIPRSGKNIQGVVCFDIVIQFDAYKAEIDRGIDKYRKFVDCETTLYLSPGVDDVKLDKIRHFDLYEEISAKGEIQGGRSVRSTKVTKYFNDANARLIKNHYELRALVDGQLYNRKKLIDFIHLGESSFQIGLFYDKNPADRLLLVLNFVFDHLAHASSGLHEMVAHLKQRYTIGQRTYSTTVMTIVSSDETFLLSEDDVNQIFICSAARRKRAILCKESFANLNDQNNNEIENEFGPQEKFLSTVGKVSDGLMFGLMTRNLIADIVNGNLPGVIWNAGFILGNAISNKLAYGLVNLAKSSSNVVARKSLLAGSSLLRRGATMAFVGYDLYDNIQEYKNNNTDALVGIGADSGYLAIETTELAIEGGEALGLIEGVSVVTGPIGQVIGVGLLIGADIYTSVKKVEKLDKKIHLSHSEKFVEGIRAFLHLQPRAYLLQMIEEKEANKALVKDCFTYLKKNEHVDQFISPLYTKKMMPEINWWDKILIWLHLESAPDENDDKYKPKFAKIRGVDLRKKAVKDVDRIIPEINKGSYFCLPPSETDYQDKNEKNFYACVNAFGIQDKNPNKASNATYLKLGDGMDHVFGFPQRKNIFELGNGLKWISGGEENDVFLITGHSLLNGSLDGLGGNDLLDFSNFNSTDPVYVTDGYLYSSSSKLNITGIESVIGRKGVGDVIFPWCTVSRVALMGGSENHHYDMVSIKNRATCDYNMSIEIGDYSLLSNEATSGIFVYHIDKINHNLDINITQNGADHVIQLDDSFSDFSSIITVVNDKSVQVKFNVFDETRISITVPLELTGFTLIFEDEVYLEFETNGTLFAKLATTKKLEECLELYSHTVAQSTLTLIVHSTVSNQTAVLSRGKSHHAAGDDDYAVNVMFTSTNHETVLKTSLHENIIFISPASKNGSIDDLHIKNTTVHLSNFVDSQTMIDFSYLDHVISLVNDTYRLVLEPRLIREHIVLDLYMINLHRDTYKRYMGSVQIFNATGMQNHSISIYHKYAMSLDIVSNVKEPIELVLSAYPLIFQPDENIIVLTREEILDSNMEIQIQKSIISNEYEFYNHDNKSLIISNALFTLPQDLNNTFTIIFHEFYHWEPMQTVLVSFANEYVALEEKWNEIENSKCAEYFYKRMADDKLYWSH